MRPGDLILVRGADWLGREIEAVSHSPYSHVAGLTPDGRLIEAQGFRRTGYQALAAYSGAYDVFTCDMASEEHRRGVQAFVESKIGTHYSYLLIGWELLHYVAHLDLPFEERQRFLCSTLWVQAYRSVGIDLCPGLRYPSPGDIALSPLLRKLII